MRNNENFGMLSACVTVNVPCIFSLSVALYSTTSLIKLFVRHILRMKEHQLENMGLKELMRILIITWFCNYLQPAA